MLRCTRTVFKENFFYKLIVLCWIEMIDVVKLMEYTQFLRRRYLVTMSELSWDEVIKDRGASFGSIRNIFLHCIACVDYIHRLFLGFQSFPRINYDDYDRIEKIKVYLESVETDFNSYLSMLNPTEFSRKIERKRRDGSVIESTVEDNLIHLFQEEIHHLGEFIALLWQLDVNPPHLGWIQYLHLKK